MLSGGSVARASSNVTGSSIKIYNDENQPASVLPPQTGQYTTGPHEEAVNKENEKKAGQWHKQKVSTLACITDWSLKVEDTSVMYQAAVIFNIIRILLIF